MTETQQKIAIGVGAGLVGLLIGRAMAKPAVARSTRATRVSTTIKYVAEAGPGQHVITDPGQVTQIQSFFSQLREKAIKGDKNAAELFKRNGPAQDRQLLVEQAV